MPMTYTYKDTGEVVTATLQEDGEWYVEWETKLPELWTNSSFKYHFIESITYNLFHKDKNV